jgi:hypothetical protein
LGGGHLGLLLPGVGGLSQERPSVGENILKLAQRPGLVDNARRQVVQPPVDAGQPAMFQTLDLVQAKKITGTPNRILDELKKLLKPQP